MIKQQTASDIINSLREARPDVAITIERELEPYLSWDGDGPSPRNEGYSPYTVIITAITIRKGEIVTGESVLGSVWYQPDDPVGDIDGYAPQMIEEAVENLDHKLS